MSIQKSHTYNVRIKKNKKLGCISLILVAIIVYFFDYGCSGYNQKIPKQILSTYEDVPPIEEKSHTTINLFYGTNRKYNLKDGIVTYGNTKALEELKRDTVYYGICSVSIPRSHKMGKIESKNKWKLQFRNNPNKYVEILSNEILDRDSFFYYTKEVVSNHTDKSALLFVHGYNNSFDAAAKRTAQLTYDLAFEGASYFFSWPSSAGFLNYTQDETSIKKSKPVIKEFIINLINNAEIDKLYIIAHSMGTRGVTEALGEIFEENPSLTSKIDETILAAPDIDAQIFKDQIANKILNKGVRFTVYASNDDKALKGSKKIHKFPRLGDSGGGLVILEGLQTIDATGKDAGFADHAYFAENNSVLSDIWYLINNDLSAEERFGLRQVKKGSNKYYKFREYCD